MAEPRTYQLTVSRLAINVCEWGDPAAPPLILQHGGRDHARSWDWVAAAFADRFRVIAPDLRGHGDSAWANDGNYDMYDFVDDFAALLRALDLPAGPMIGHSLGGNIVTRFAGLYPDKVTKLINIEGLGEGPDIVNAKAPKDPLERMRRWIARRADLVPRTPRDYPDLATIVERMKRTDERLTGELAEHLATHAARANPDGTLRLKHDPAMGTEPPNDITPEVKAQMWAAITCPVLLIYGADSWAPNPATDGRAAHFRDARVELFERAGHWVHHDRRDDFIAMAGEFIG